MKNLPTCFANKNIKDMKRTTTMLRYVSVVLIALFGLAPAVLAQIHTGPTVGGAVYGGGRMADVSGNTVVTVINADSLGAVFGGNDISGAVSGTATVTVGTTNTNAGAVNANGETLADGIKIGSVYGGGNGFYKYSTSATFGDALPDDATGTLSVPTVTSVVVNVADDGSATIAAAQNLVQIDSLFGGAKAAYVTANTADAIKVNIGGGAIIAAFGGNNYGGTIGATSGDTPGDAAKITINVHGTEISKARTYYATALDVPTPNSATSGFGRDYGVRYLFGGGNKVEAPIVEINLAGGMIDTAFAGGNSATVAATTVNATYAEAQRIYENPTLPTIADMTPANTHWVGGSYRYNVHTLFGGNNEADMVILPTLNLNGGGFGTVYGGGNAGKMLGDHTLTVDGIEYHRSTYVHLASGSNARIDYLYGGCQEADVTNATLVHMEGGYAGTIYGGCNISGDVSTVSGYDADTRTNRDGYGTNVLISGDAVVYCNVFGGANGYYHCNDLTRYVSGIDFKDNHIPAGKGWAFDFDQEYIGYLIPTHNSTHTKISGGHIYGNVYGGANLANVGYGTTVATVGGVGQNYGTAQLMISGGTIDGNVYGGGNMASVFGTSDLQVVGGTINGDLYAGNDKSGSVQAFGPLPTATASNGDPLNDGNEPLYSAYVKVSGDAQVNRVFGGGNGAYDYGDGNSVQGLEEVETCSLGGIGTKPLQKSSYVDICINENGRVDTVFGGGNGVTVVEGVTVLINSTPTTEPTIGTVFGGNNQSLMANIVAAIKLEKGTIENVYGGGNAGDMEGTKHFADICNDTLVDKDGKKLDISTYILVNSPDITVTGSMYAGCNMANLKNTAFVDVRQTSTRGIMNLFGGNNVAGEIENTRIDISGGVIHNIFGGSNGRYDYRTYKVDGIELGRAYAINEQGIPTDELVAEGKKFNATSILTISSPMVDSTNVNIRGGQINSSVYGGGLYGDVKATYVLVDDTPLECGTTTQSPARINGSIYGGGKGDTIDLCRTHQGNVDTAIVDLKHVGALSGAKAYAGGKGGDVNVARLTVYPTWDKSFDALYGGCWGSDIVEQTTVIMNGTGQVTNFYGGNDYTGNVKASYVHINNGRYGNIYGGGNGDYDYSSTNYQVPNIEDVTLNIAANNNIQVAENLYGGGRMGTTFKVNHDTETGKALRTDCKLVADTACSAIDYAHILMNIHGGEYMHDIYAGGAGPEGGSQITYAVKQINMDGGTVRQSIYGGTQNVDDGFGHNCERNMANTMPSSILNLTGGTFMANAYGGGFLGNIYGSTYVNVGIDAVNASPVWTNTYRGRTFADYKPTLYTATTGNGEADSRDSLVAAQLIFNTSIFGGANWGEAGTESNFERTEGYYGGESRILIDGNGYNTASTPVFDITKSVICAGTSTNGGDIVSDITFRNYGTVNGCNGATKEIESIQRADNLTLENTAILYKGAVDAASAYSATSYAINRIGNFTAKGFNNISIQKPVDNINVLNFVDASGTVIGSPMTTRSTDCDICNQLTINDNAHTMIYVLNGTYVRVMRDGTYGDVNGWAYVVSDEGYKAQLIAANTTGDEGGYVSPCNDENNAATNDQIGWTTLDYRLWTLGEGSSAVAQQIDAFSNVAGHPEINRLFVGEHCGSSTTTDNLAIAKATLQLPAVTETGHYYKFNSGVIVDAAKGAMKLIDAAWKPAVAWNDLNTDNWDDATTAQATKQHTNNVSSTTCVDASGIVASPDDHFGLMIVPGAGFATGNSTPISANSNYSTGTPYQTPGVSEPGMPEIDLYLTYSNQFARTIVGDVSFTLAEYDASGVYVGDVEVTITINTIIDKFQGTHVDLLAMYNEGTSDTYVRKRIIPATMTSRKLYLSAVRWEPVTTRAMAGDGTGARGDRKVIASDDPYRATEANGGIFRVTDGSVTGYNNLFGLKANLTEDLTNNLTSINGWYTNGSSTHDIYSITADNCRNFSNPAATTTHNNNEGSSDTVLITSIPSHLVFDADGNVTGYDGGYSDDNFSSLSDDDRGYFMGTLDGRASAAIDYELNFDGSMMFPDGFAGRVILDYAYYKGNVYQGRFFDTLYVKLRTAGDTIFMASADQVTRCGITLDHNAAQASTVLDEDKGKRPSLYLQSFEVAFNNDKIYQEGDVFAIIDEMVIKSNTVMRGIDMTRVPVIRYSGHHSDLPGECGAYRDNMFRITYGARFSAFNVTFDGSSVSKVWDATQTATDKKVLDTMAAAAPIFLVEQGSTLSLSSGTVVRNNYNQSTDNAGAIRLVDASTLLLNNDVTIKNNLNATGESTDLHPLFGAVQADKGVVELGTSSSGAIIADANYLLTAGTQYWKDETFTYNGNQTGTRRVIDEETIASLKQANVFLGREGLQETLCENETDELHDSYNSVVRFSSELAEGTHVGISKWFAGETVRDTMTVVQANLTNSGFLQKALTQQLFNDNGAYEFYYRNSEPLNGRRFYYHRCASFRNQDDAVLCEDPVLTYNYDMFASCPAGTDTLVYGFRGGFAPYSVTWTKAGASDAIQTTANMAKSESGNMTDSYVIPLADMDMGHNPSKTVTYTITATEALECATSKTVTITYTKSDAESGVTYGTGEASNTDIDPEHTATIARNFKGTHLTAIIWPEETFGSVSASDANGELNLNEAYFCDGEVITLNATPASGKSFAMWDFDPYDQPTTPYIINALNPTVTAYFTPGTRWINYVNSESVANAVYDSNYYYTERPSNAGFVTTHDGDVHIYTENGLAWFISMVNGINGAQAHPYYFNRVYLHDKEGGYDMKDYLWTPVGREQHPFRGRFFGVSSDAADTTVLTVSRVVIKNIIVNEPALSNVGFFGVLDTAVVKGIEIQSSLFHGAQYVGGIAAKAVNGVTLNNVKVGDAAGENLTMITTHYVSGGILGSGDGSAKPIKLGDAEASAKYMGDAVYSGGIVGEATSMTIENSFARNDDRMEAVYKGGVAGRLNGTGVNAKSADGNSVVRNNYVYMISNGGAQNMGGLVAYARNTVMENNYVYGKVEGSQLHGAVGADLGNGVYADNNYYEQHSATQQVGNGHGTAHVNTVVTFAGQGNDVTTSQPVYGVDNLTRVLNIWVRDHRQESDYRTWRSDLTGSNGGYPIFGTPDMITVRDSAIMTACDSIEIDGVVYTESAVINTSVIDSLMMIDSTTTLTLVIHHGSHETYTDSATFGESYFGYGFSLTATETELLRSTVDEYGTATLVLSDTLQTENGCDSIVTLNLVLTDNLGIVETGTTHIAVYPNPTTARVTVEAEQLRFVEVYDNEGRRLMATPEADNHMSTTVDVSNYASGVYYLRVHTQNSVTIQKLIKK